MTLDKEVLSQVTSAMRIKRPVKVTFLHGRLADAAIGHDNNGRWMMARGKHRILLHRDNIGRNRNLANEVLLHELRHAQQNEAWMGHSHQRQAEDVYEWASFKAHIRGRHPYRDNYFEKDARMFSYKNVRRVQLLR